MISKLRKTRIPLLLAGNIDIIITNHAKRRYQREDFPFVEKGNKSLEKMEAT